MSPEMQEALNLAITAAATILVALVTTFVPILAAKLSKKWGVQVKREQQEMIEQLAKRAIGYAEERAYRALKSGEDQGDIGSESKRSHAKARLASDCGEVGILCSQQDLDAALDAALAERRGGK